jgi:hypothetical protein
MRRLLFTLLALGGLLASSRAQSPNLQPDRPGEKPAPVITFDLAFPAATPPHYSFTVESTGRAAYRSDDVGQQGRQESAAGDPYAYEFTISPSVCSRIFELAREANYFKGDFNYTKTRVADTGTKTLTYSEGPLAALGKPTQGVLHQTVYNYSENAAIQQLTTIFQSTSNTLELGRRLTYLRRFDKLGLDAVLKRAEEMVQEQQLQELQAIAPTLRAIADDYSVMHIARERAKHLLQPAGATAK